MKKTLLLATAIVASFALNAQTYLLTFESLYSTIKDGITASTESAAFVSGSTSKILINADRTVGIFTLVSPSARTFRLDTCTVTFNGHSHVAKIRLETNGASNSTNGRKVYIDCPAAGTLKVGAWTGTTGRGYSVETESGTVISSANASMTAPTETKNLEVHTYSISSAGKIVLNPNNGFYYGFIQFEVPVSSVKDVFVSKGITISKSEIQNANNVELEVYNITGKKVTSSKENISLTYFSKGVYIVRIAGTGETQKFTI